MNHDDQYPNRARDAASASNPIQTVSEPASSSTRHHPRASGSNNLFNPINKSTRHHSSSAAIHRPELSSIDLTERPSPPPPILASEMSDLQAMDPLPGSLRAFYQRNKGLAYVLLAQVFGVLMNVTTRLLEIEGNHGAGMHPFQASPLSSPRTLSSMGKPLTCNARFCLYEWRLRRF